jgi:hypothetical protein
MMVMDPTMTIEVCCGGSTWSQLTGSSGATDMLNSGEKPNWRFQMQDSR